MTRTSWITRLCDGTAPASWSKWDATALSQAGLSGSLDDFRSAEFFASNAVLMAATLFGWEYIVTLPSEARLYTQTRRERPKIMLFVLVRYSTLAGLVLGAYAIWHRGECLAHSQVPTMLVQFSACTVFAERAAASWRYDVRIVVLEGLLLVTLLVFSGLVTMTLRPARLPNGSCILHQGDIEENFFTVPYFYAGTLLYTVTLFVLQLWGLLRKSDSKVSWYRRTYSQLQQRDVYRLLMALALIAAFFAIGYQSQRSATALLVLYMAVMCSVCQHMLLTHYPRVENKETSEEPTASTELVLSTFLKSSSSVDSHHLPVCAPVRPADEDECCTVLQLHDFQQCEPTPLALKPPPCCNTAAGGPSTAKHNADDNDEPIEYLMINDSAAAETSELEVADILANMSDDAKSVALALAGMEDRPPPDRIYEPRYHRNDTRRQRAPTRWLMQPPLM